MIFVDYLCTSICECALAYYFDNKDKFSFDCHAIHVNNLFPERDEEDTNVQPQTDEELTNEIKNNPDFLNFIRDYIDRVLTEERIQEALLKELKNKLPKKTSQKVQTRQHQKKSNQDKKESQVRSFFGRHFKKQFYKEHKEEIIDMIISSKTKKQIKDKLNRTYSQTEAFNIYKKLQPLLDDTLKLK